MSKRIHTPLFVLGLMPIALASTARAEGDCASDSDCPDGFVCEVTGGSSCACEPNVPCDCETVDWYSCVPGPCTSDADCGEDLVCVTYEVPCATSAPCSPDGDCPPPEPCEASTQSVCAPKWVLPCETAADCGDGFTCEESEMCTCSAGSGEATPDSGETPPEGDSGGGSDGGSDGGTPSESDATPAPEESECTCEPSGEMMCVMQQIVCEDDSACPEGWSCQRYTVPVDCVEPAPPPPEGGGEGGGSGSDGEPPADGDSGCPEPAGEPPSEGVCAPDYYGGYYGYGYDDGAPRGEDAQSASEEGNGATSGAPPTAPTDSAAPIPEAGSPGAQPASGCGGAGGASGAALVFVLLIAWRRRTAALS